MSGTGPTVNVRLGTTGAEKVKKDFENLENSGTQAGKRVQAAFAAASPELQKLAGAADVANRAFTGMGGSLGRVGDVAGRVSGVAGGITTGFLALGAAAATSAVAIAKAGDSYTATMAKLTSASGGVSQAQAAYEGLFRLSQQTGVSVADSAAAFSRFAVAAKEVGATNEQVLRLTAGLQKAGIVAGASADEAKAGALQLAQALASGVLQGDELRSVLENMPQLAQALAKEFGVGIGALRQMGAEGKLTADQVLPRLLKAAEDIGQEFDKQPKTMAQASGVLKESLTDLAARLDKAAGISERFRDAMLAAAGAFRAVGTFVAPTDRESIVASRNEAMRRAEMLRTQLRGADDIRQLGIGQLASPEDRRLPVDQLRQQLAAEESAIRTHNDRLAEMDKEAAAERWGQQVTAQQRAAASAAESAKRALDEKRGGWNAERKAREDHRKAMELIDKAEATGAISSMEATQERALVNKQLADALDKLKEKVEKVGEAHRATGKAAQEADAHVQDWYKAQEKAAQEAAKAQEKAAEAIRKYHEKSWDDVATIGERAFDRVVDAGINALFTLEGRAINFGNVFKGVLLSGAADLLKLGALNPLLNSVMPLSSGPRSTLAAAFGSGGAGATSVGFGDILGLGSVFGGESIGGMLGLTGAGGLLSASVIPGIGSATNAALGAMGGAFGPATPSAVAAQAGIFGGSGATLGSLLGGAGAGFGAGMLLNNLLGGKQTGGMVGSGLGGLAGAAIGSIIPGIGTLIGGLLGGAAGGGLGGLIGPGESVKGYGYQLNAAPDGLLRMGASFYNDTGSAAFKEAEQGIAALNAYLGARGLTVGGASIVGGNKDGGDLSNATATTFGQGVSQLYYHSNNAQLEYALAGRGNRFGSSAEMQSFVDGFFQIQDVIKGLTEKPLPAFEQQLKAVNDNFAAVTAQAQKYSLSLDEVNRAQAEAVAALEKQRTEQLTQSDKSLEIRMLTAKGDAQGAALAQQAEATRQEINNFTAALDALGISAADKAARLIRLEEVQAAERAAIIQRFGEQAANNLTTTLDQAANAGTSLLRELTYGSSSALAPEQKYFAAISDLSAARQALDAGGSLSAYTAVAQAVLPVARDFLGTSTRYAGLAAEVGSVIASKGGDGNLAAILSAQANGMDGLQATLASLGTQQISVATNTLNEMRRLSSLIEAWITRNKAA